MRVRRVSQITREFSHDSELQLFYFPPTSTTPHILRLVAGPRYRRKQHGHVQVREYHLGGKDERKNLQYALYFYSFMYLKANSIRSRPYPVRSGIDPELHPLQPQLHFQAARLRIRSLHYPRCHHERADKQCVESTFFESGLHVSWRKPGGDTTDSARTSATSLA